MSSARHSPQTAPKRAQVANVGGKAMPSGVIVGLDPSLTAAGVAVIRDPSSADTPNRPMLATLGETGRRGATIAERATRLDRQAVRIMRAMPATTRLVVIEDLDTFMPGRGALSERLALWWDLVRRIGRAGVPVAVVHPSTLKKWATGDGKAGKHDVVAAMRELWPTASIRNDNEADALALATIGAQRIGWHDPELPHHIAPAGQWPETLTRSTR